jgi:hypothetical protein
LRTVAESAAKEVGFNRDHIPMVVFHIVCTGRDSFVAVASQPELIGADIKYGGFELVNQQNVLLAITKTLAEHGVQNRSIFHLRVIS